MRFLKYYFLIIGFVPLLALSQISQMEYFFDTDPGFGSGTPITISSPDSSILLSNEVINASGLSLGFHTLYLRAYSNTNVYEFVADSAVYETDTIATWGGYESRLVFVDEDGSVTIDIDAVEYFFDTDPGYGNGTIINLTAANIQNFTNTLDASGLPLGFHNLYLRARTSGGRWGQAESRLVFVDQSGSVAEDIDAFEYFFDSDPGYGNGTIVNVTPDSIINVQETLDASGLSLGFHNLYLRVRDSGGKWGQAESRLVFVDQSGSIADDIDAFEYFFDTDPGYGNGNVVNIAPAAVINIQDTLEAGGLSLGFHNLYLRARDSGGNWGQAESRLIYVDQSGNIIAPINEIEYFIDSDPGYGQANSIPVTPDFSVFLDFAINTGTLPEGPHTLFVRAKDSDGNWGMAESFQFSTYGPGRELDSATLRTMYNSLSGDTWTDNTNWLTTSIDNWFGVSVVNGRVDSLALSENNLTGKVPFQTGYLSELKKLDLSENNLNDTLPGEFIQLLQLEELYLHDNALNQLPDLSVLTLLNSVSLDSNFFDFADIEPLAFVPNITYSNQQFYDQTDSDSVVSIGQALTIDPEFGITSNNLYQWFLNGDTIPSQDLASYEITDFMATDTGIYQLKIQNSVITDLTISSPTYYAILNDFDQDSLALVSLYNATSGTDWLDNTNWLSGDLSTWSGVSLTDQRVTQLSLPGNNLSGVIPDDFIYADSIVTLDFSGNEIESAIPENFSDFVSIETIDLSSNNINQIPSFSTVTSLQTLDVSSNKLQFGELEDNLGIPTFNYSPQDSISMTRDTIVDSESTTNLEFTVSGANNSYQWYKDGQPIAGATSSDLEITNIQFADEGSYRLEITNSIVPGLTLTSGEIILKVSSLERDEAALLAIYDATDGPNWTAEVNWTSEDILDWDSVTFNNANDRVTGLSLQNSGLSGNIPTDIRDITSLETLDLSGNSITGIPNMSQMPALTSFDIRENDLEFDDLEPNITITGFEFDPQNPLQTGEDILVEQGSTVTLSYTVDGSNNQYQWTLDGEDITGANEDTYVIDSINFEDMGNYKLNVSSTEIPDFTISSEDQLVQATADIFGIVLGQGDQPLPSGSMDALEIVPGKAAYDSLDQQVTVSNGEFVVPDLVLGNYVCVTITDDEVYIPTYVGNTEDWQQADTIFLRADFEVSGYSMILIPAEPTDGEAQFSMLVESDFGDEGDSGSRVEARRRVKKAGCSLRRRVTGGGRIDQDEFELIAYKETDDNGEVSFGRLPVGVYRINIQYPGIPVDPDAFTEFEVAEGAERSDISVSALVTEEGISIELVRFITAYQKYFRDLKVYPNPASDYFMIKYDRLLSDNVRVKLTDMQGRLIKDLTVEKGYDIEKKVSIGEMDEGIYFLYFYDPEIEQQPLSVFKVIINR